MDWTCKKCGKTLEVSEEQLDEMQGVVICPQCLGSERVPGYRHKTATAVSNRSSDDNSTRPLKSSTPPAKPSPPPYRKKTNQVEKVSTPAPSTRTATTPKKKKKKKRNKRGPLAPHTSLGCMWRSVIYTLILLAIATVVGFILDFI
jgi:hypothetical protein